MVKFTLTRSREVWGLRFELAGLLVVLAATFWQLTVTDWWDQQLREWQAYIQEDVNLAVLLSLKDLGYIATVEDKTTRQRVSTAIYERTSRAVNDAISKREERRKAIREGQPEAFAKVRMVLLLLGAGLLVVGKWMTLSAVRLRTSPGGSVVKGSASG